MPNARSTGRWWVAVVVASIASIPLIWLLSFGALLPFMLGLFFFVLFGLVIGAVTHRVAAAGRPYGRGTLLAGTAVIVAFIWGGALVKESYDFPRDMAKLALTPQQKIGERTPAQYRALVADQAREFLKERHPPGGALGYMQWMLLSGVVEKGELPAVSRTLRRGQTRVFFVVRLVASLALLGFGVGSQTWSLRLATEPSNIAVDETGQADGD